MSYTKVIVCIMVVVAVIAPVTEACDCVNACYSHDCYVGSTTCNNGDSGCHGWCNCCLTDCPADTYFRIQTLEGNVTTLTNNLNTCNSQRSTCCNRASTLASARDAAAAALAKVANVRRSFNGNVRRSYDESDDDDRRRK